MMSRGVRLRSLLPVAAVIAAGCSRPDISIEHRPVVATSSDTVTFTATSNTDSSDFEIEILVNAAVERTCTSSPCTVTVGPFPAYEGTTVSFLANIVENDCSDNCTNTDGYHYFGVTDASYNWGTRDYIPARIQGSIADSEDLLFHKAADYGSGNAAFRDFVDDVGDKIYDVMGAQDIVEDHMDDINYWVYNKQAANASNCGEVHADTDTDISWRDDDAVLHVTNFGDCTNIGLTHFSAEGGNTKAFLHEAGHGVFGLADEYCGPTYYFQPANEPNIWSTESGCQSEQTAKGRSTSACNEFCTNSGGWWGIHTGTTVMTTGNVGDPWFTEGEEHLNWYFNNL